MISLLVADASPMAASFTSLGVHHSVGNLKTAAVALTAVVAAAISRIDFAL